MDTQLNTNEMTSPSTSITVASQSQITEAGSPVQRPSDAGGGSRSNQSNTSARGGSAQSKITTLKQSFRQGWGHRKSVNGSDVANGRSNAKEMGSVTDTDTELEPAALVPALLAPVPPPPPKRKLAKTKGSSPSKGDVEVGQASEDVLEDAPDKTTMEMLQAYLRKQNLRTQIVLIGLLLVLGGGVFGAYVVLLYKAISERNVKFIVLCSVFSLVLVWVIWKYWFDGDEKLQDQSAIAQDIATLYAAIPDHTALKGVSERGRAQFTDFKYEKSEMMFTAVTDDGVSLGSERGSELMMDGADPACPLCNNAYIEGADLCLLPCLHVFHKDCIHKWCNKHIVCPLCKRHLEAPQPLHNLTAVGDSSSHAQSEPGRHGPSAGRSAGPWKNMLGAQIPGPASCQGSERGLGGTRSEDGLWNDRVLNAAQRQQVGTSRNRVTSFSSDTRRTNSARGRTGSAGRGGPPPSGSSGRGAIDPRKRSSSYRHTNYGSGGERGHTRDRGYQRQRSSSFSTASERGRGSSGRVLHGTRPERGGAAPPPGDSGSPRSRSDLGLRRRDADRMRATSDALLSRHAMRNSRSSIKPNIKNVGEHITGAWTGEPRSNAERARGTMPVLTGSKSGVISRRQGPAVITVRKVRPGGPAKASSVPSGRGRPSSSLDWTQHAGSAESDWDGNQKGEPNIDGEESDSPVTTKALSYGPRKPRVTSNRPRATQGHRRVSSCGSSTSAEDSCSSRRPRRRFSSSSGGKSGKSTIQTRLPGRSSSKQRTKVEVQGATSFSGNSSGDSSSSDDQRHSIVRRRSSTSVSASALGTSGVSTQQRNSAPVPKGSSPSTGPITKGTPAPPMAAARAASWNMAPVPSTTECPTSDETDPPAQGRPLESESPHGSFRQMEPAEASTQKESFAGSASRRRGESDLRRDAINQPGSAMFTELAIVPMDTNCQGASPTDGDRVVHANHNNHKVFRSCDKPEETRIGRPGRSGKVQDLVKSYENPLSSYNRRLHSDDRDGESVSDFGPSTRSTTFGNSGRKFHIARRRSSKSISSIHQILRAESDCDDEQVHRPKLSYDKRRRKFGDKAHSRSTSSEDANFEGIHVPRINLNRGDWENEDTYVRPKLSYGGGLVSSKSKSFDRGDSTVDSAAIAAQGQSAQFRQGST